MISALAQALCRVSYLYAKRPLLEGALRTGLTATEYRDALDAAREIAIGGLNRNSAYDALDLLDAACSVAAVDDVALQAFAVGLLSDMAVLRARLTPGQRALARQLGAPFGWVEPEDAVEAPEATSLAERLAGRSVAIYTLTESAGRQARGLLEAAAPRVRVVLNHDHGGTAPLAALVRNADLFVVAACSATHAATDFIRARRGDGPLVYAAGRGAASILRAVERWTFEARL